MAAQVPSKHRESVRVWSTAQRKGFIVNRDKAEAILFEVKKCLESDYFSEDPVSQLNYTRDLINGVCPESGATFELCSVGVCDCGWENLPWEQIELVDEKQDSPLDTEYQL